MFLDPTKLLVILIVALVVLGPDKLPTVARQMGAAWGELRRLRQRLETEVRGTFPDLPSSQQMVQAVRSPLSFLDQLADAHEREQRELKDADLNGTAEPNGTAQSNGAERADGAQPDVAMQPAKPAAAIAPDAGNADGITPAEAPDPDVAAQGSEPSVTGAVVGPTGRSPRPLNRQVGRTRPWHGSQSGEPGMIPDDPSMN